MNAEVDAVELADLLSRVETGWTRRTVGSSSWAIRRVDRAAGRTTTLTAEELGGTGLISANIWHTSDGAVLRPCEMPASDVLEFLRQLPPVQEGAK